MASIRHRHAPQPSSSSRNPFDSSDDENEAPGRRTYENPFDDEAADGTSFPSNLRNSSRPPPHNSKHLSHANATNPFDDAGEEEEEEELEEKEQKSRSERQGGLTDRLDRGNLFDEESRFYGDADLQDPKATHKSAASALNKMRKMKDAGAVHASKMMDGGIHQAHRLKEGSLHAFRSTEGKTNPSEHEKSTAFGKFKKDAHDRKAANSNGPAYARSQLLAEEMEPGAGGKGNPRNGGSGLFESTAPRAGSHTRYDDHLFQGSEIEQRNVQELEGYAVQKSEDTTKSVQNCVRVAEEIKGDATHTLLSLHQQGEQLRRTHEVANDIDYNLTTGEHLLGNLGGMFSRTWKPHKSPAIKGPVDDPKDFELRRKGHHLQQRTALGLVPKPEKDRPTRRVSDSQAQTMEEKLEVEKTKQDDGLSELSNVLDQLKDMTMDMGDEISRQNDAMDNFNDDLGVLGDRVKVVNARGRHLLRK